MWGHRSIWTWLGRPGRKEEIDVGDAGLEPRIGMDRLNVDLSQSVNKQSPAPDMSVDLVSSYKFNVAFHASATACPAIQFLLLCLFHFLCFPPSIDSLLIVHFIHDQHQFFFRSDVLLWWKNQDRNILF